MAGLIPNVGKKIISGRMIGGTTPTQTEPRWVGWGEGATAPAAGATDISTPSTEARVAGTGSQVTISQTNDTHQIVATITADGTKTITNIGVFDAAGTGSPPSGGVLYAHGDVTPIPLVLNDQITFTIKVQFP